MYILVDDENRENEGDLVVPASNITAKKINFMAKYGRGLICLSLTDKQAKKLNLSLMSPVNKSRNQTAFTISIEQEEVLPQEFLPKTDIPLLKPQLRVM